MHKIQSYPITRESFEIDDYTFGLEIPIRALDRTAIVEDIEGITSYSHDDMIDGFITYLENLRLEYNAIIDALKLPQGDPEKVKALQEYANIIWKELIRWLPESWLQTRTVTMNYETVRAMCSPGQRRFHKLNEWSGKNNPKLTNFISWARTLPYAHWFIFTDEYNEEQRKKREAELSPIDKIAYELKKIGIEIKNPDGSYRNLTRIMGDISKYFANMLIPLKEDGAPMYYEED